LETTDKMVDFKDEWTQEEFLQAKKKLEKEGKKVLLIDIIAKPIEGADNSLQSL